MVLSYFKQFCGSTIMDFKMGRDVLIFGQAFNLPATVTKVLSCTCSKYFILLLTSQLPYLNAWENYFSAGFEPRSWSSLQGKMLVQLSVAITVIFYVGIVRVC